VSEACATTRPVWLFSLDSENFHAAPTTTGSLLAWYRVHGERGARTSVHLVHLRERADVAPWVERELARIRQQAGEGADTEYPPLAGFSMYTWNAAEFLALAHTLQAAVPGLALVAGGPHVQQAEDWLGEEPFDAIVLGEGEQTLQQLLDTPRSQWGSVAGLALRAADGGVRRTAARARVLKLEELPSPFDVLELADAEGRPLYDAVTCETSRGCPFKCAFCEWGTGAIGTKMVSFPLARLERDWKRIVQAGIPNIWLTDSNFGALREDLAKAEAICALKQRYGLPRTFATSWSKKHSERVQQIVLMLHAHGLLPFYQLALQTLTPRALELCHRENMAANEYEPIARRMAEAGVPISAELIWGLPGDDLASFERNLDRLLATFPDINIFAYTLLPGTEFHRRREEYRIETVPVAGFGKAKGEYVVASLSFDRAEGEEGYFLVTAHLVLVSGHIMASVVRYLALSEAAPVGGLLRAVLQQLLASFEDALPQLDPRDRLEVYAARAELYLRLLADPERLARCVRATTLAWLEQHDANAHRAIVERLLELDCWLMPRWGEPGEFRVRADFDVSRVLECVAAMRLPERAAFDGHEREYHFRTPGGLGVVLQGPDGGRWLQSRLLDPPVQAAPWPAPVETRQLVLQ
jgi:hypothetical protein